MLARDELQRLLRTMVDVYADNGYPPNLGMGPPDWVDLPREVFGDLFSAEQEEAVAEVGAALAGIAAAAARSRPEAEPPRSAIVGALAGAELVLRGELLAGRGDRVPGQLPGFAYLATLPYLGTEEALRLSTMLELSISRLGS